jgi:hypothetical protein
MVHMIINATLFRLISPQLMSHSGVIEIPRPQAKDEL